MVLLNRELVEQNYVRFAFSQIIKDCPKIRNLPKIFLRSFKNVAPGPHCKAKFDQHRLWQVKVRALLPSLFISSILWRH